MNSATATTPPSTSSLYGYNINGDRLIFEVRQDTSVFIESRDTTYNLYLEIYNELERS